MSEGSSPPDVSIVIVSWNVSRLLVDCLQSIERHKGALRCEVIVVDNASADDSVKRVAEEFPAVRLVANRDNVGFAIANNQGFELATGRHVFILNPDTLLVDGSLERMVRELDARAAVGMVGPRLCFLDGETQRFCARRLPSLMDVLLTEILPLDALHGLRPLLRERLEPYAYDRSQPVEAISGAAMLVRREVLAQIAGFGETFIHGGEDLDLCFRLRKAGFELWYLHDCTVVHFGGQSSKQVPEWAAVNSLLSYGEYFARTRTRAHALLLRLMVVTMWVPTRLALGVVRLGRGADSREQLRQRWKMARSLVTWKRVR